MPSHLFTTTCFTFLLLSIFTVLASPSVPHEILNGFFNGRSGDVVIAPKNLTNDDSFLILKYSDDAYKSSEIDETQLADLISHLVGTTPVNLDASRSYFPEIDLFQRPKANLFIAFDSVGEDEILQAPGLNFLNIGQKIRIVNSSYPRNSISKLTTLLTGKTPSTHGIVSESWDSEGDSVRAYSSQGLPLTANFPDILSQSFNGRSLTFALSANFQLASASSVHRTTLTRQPFWNNYAFYWNSIEEFVDSPSSSRLQHQFMITRSHLLQSLSSSKTLNFLENSGITARYQKNSNSLQVILQDRSRVDFDLNNKEILSFFIELELVQILMNQLQAHSPLQALLEDESPDHFSIIFSSLKGIQERKGKDSTTFKACLHILDQLVSRIISTFENAYDNRVITQLVFLGNDNSAQLIPKIQNSLAPSLFTKLGSKLPQVYLTQSNITFSTIEEALTSTDFKAHFFPKKRSEGNTAHWRSERAYIDLSEEILAGTNNTNKTYTYVQVATFHMCLWTPIILAIILIFVIYMLAYMSSQDSTLYRSTQPRHAHQS